MRSANWIQETTTSIAGTSGNGAVTLTSIANTPRFSSAFGSQATTVRYVIEQVSTGRREAGIGSVSSNVLTRTRPQVTWTGSVWDDSTPSPLQFGATPASGDVLVSIAALAESLAPVMPGANSISGDATWRDYPITNNVAWNGNGSAGTLTADVEYYTCHRLDTAGLLTGVQFDCMVAVASSALKLALYPCAHTGLPGAKIVDFNTLTTTTTGIKTDTTTSTWAPSGPVWLSAGWYFVGFMSGHAIGLRGFAGAGYLVSRTPLGRHGAYGWGSTISVSGSYATGLPASPSPTTMMDPAANPLNIPWIGLRVEA